MTAPPAPSVHLSPTQLERLSRVVSAERLWSGDERTLAYGRDESDLGDYPPSAVALAETTAEVSDLLRICSSERIPVTPSAARTGKSGGSLPVHAGLVLSLERMNRILEIRKEDLTGTAQPGVITGDYQRAVEALGLFYPPDPASLDLCSLGGNV